MPELRLLAAPYELHLVYVVGLEEVQQVVDVDPYRTLLRINHLNTRRRRCEVILGVVHVWRRLAEVIYRQQHQLEFLLLPIQQLHPDAALKEQRLSTRTLISFLNMLLRRYSHRRQLTIARQESSRPSPCTPSKGT